MKRRFEIFAVLGAASMLMLMSATSSLAATVTKNLDIVEIPAV
jgi:hypothetical protein